MIISVMSFLHTDKYCVCRPHCLHERPLILLCPWAWAWTLPSICMGACHIATSCIPWWHIILLWWRYIPLLPLSPPRGFSFYLWTHCPTLLRTHAWTCWQGRWCTWTCNAHNCCMYGACGGCTREWHPKIEGDARSRWRLASWVDLQVWQ